MEKKCVSCGMPLEQASDHALGDMSKDYCGYCARPDGEMQSFEERLQNYSGWLVRTQGLDPEAALEQSKLLMAEMPAWKPYFKR